MAKHVVLTYSPSLADKTPKPCVVNLEDISAVVPNFKGTESYIHFKNGHKFWVKEPPEKIFKMIGKKKNNA